MIERVLFVSLLLLSFCRSFIVEGPMNKVVASGRSLFSHPIESSDGQTCGPLYLRSDNRRRKLLLTSFLGFCPLLPYEQAEASTLFQSFYESPSNELYSLSPLLRNSTVLIPIMDADDKQWSSEIYLLKLLPVKNPLFRSLVATIGSLPRTSFNDNDAWKKVPERLQLSLEDLDNKRSQLEPVFNPSDPSTMQISKGERCERLIESFRAQMVELSDMVNASERNATRIADVQRSALIGLSDLGELLVTQYPYEVPTEKKFSYLPRLLGRARVTLTFRRKSKILGNVTILADGYAAPITAGNFVDLAARNFYTGLPIKTARKRLSSGSDFEVATVPMLGSFQEGFFDPLTAKPRRLPLEVVRISKKSGVPSLTYSTGLSKLSPKRSLQVENAANSRPLISFRTRGVVAMNHAERNPNGASSEFFALQKTSTEKPTLFDGEYAPFGYIIEGMDLFDKLQASDVIDQTTVSEWGILNLVKLRPSSFSEVVQGSEAAKEEKLTGLEEEDKK